MLEFGVWCFDRGFTNFKHVWLDPGAWNSRSLPGLRDFPPTFGKAESRMPAPAIANHLGDFPFPAGSALLSNAHNVLASHQSDFPFRVAVRRGFRPNVSARDTRRRHGAQRALDRSQERIRAIRARRRRLHQYFLGTALPGNTAAALDQSHG